MKGSFVLSAVLLFVPGPVLGQEAVNIELAPVSVDVGRPGPVVIGNKTCPVSGTVISGDMIGKEIVEYNGKVYNLCCAACRELFLKEAEKYAYIAEVEAATPVVGAR